MHKIINVCLVLAALLFIAIYSYLGSLPPEKFDIANTAELKIVLSLILSSVVVLTGLFMFLFFGSIVRSLRRRRSP